MGGNDAFGAILSLKPRTNGNGNGSVSMLERQRVLEGEKRRAAERQAELWEGLGRGSSPAPPVVVVGEKEEEEEDILAAFGRDVKVDRASYYPPPPLGSGGRVTPLGGLAGLGSGGFGEDDGDDPFGLGAAPKMGNAGAAAQVYARQEMGDDDDDDDDILGNLGKPVAEKSAQKPVSKHAIATEEEEIEYMDTATAKNGSEDKALAELVEMGFPTDTARLALIENGGNVQGAVGWLLQQAHEESK